MGSYGSRLLSASNSAVNSVVRSRKRKCIEEDDYASEDSGVDKALQTPKKRRTATAEYVYQALFLGGEGSDITLYMLGKAWNLHKVYIKQSPYFNRMFSGDWIESDKNVIHVEITDPNITLQSLSAVLGSLYNYEMTFEPKDVISILATLRMLHLDQLINECEGIMVETTNIKTVVPYYNASIAYGVPRVQQACKTWLEVNLLAYGWLYPSFLKEVTPSLMAELIASPQLVAMQTEFCIYMMLRSWLYVHLEDRNDTTQMEEYYKNHPWTEPFLDTKEGREYCAPFKALRKKYLLLNDQDVKILYSDNIIPEDWLFEAYKEQWLHILKIDANNDTGPKYMEDQEFSRECFRCARCVDKAGEHVWRWTAFHFGLDLVVSLDSTTLRIKRYNRTETEHIKANHSKHNVIIRIRLISLNEQRQIKHIQDSDQVKLSLHKNEEKQVMSLDKEITYPLTVSVNMQVVTPFLVSPEPHRDSDQELPDLDDL
ncbi:hypothetical protein QAD02_010813 [Eretmocerus hayati]|uniref:Uncharacterized protein n=1 Tax=Eretmocerus hayati TaxID=131215 RepID=A0ACC2NXU6_9HYME|nr:hypothetical protein QAD02_010813 [Eretmocerus hayati]